MRFKMAQDKTSLPTTHRKPWREHSRWFFLFLAAGAVVYLQAMREKNHLFNEVSTQLYLLEREKALAVAEREDLALQIQSQSDPAWVEMVLKRNLGMIREGQVKVYFHAD